MEIVKLLTDNGANINHRGANGNTPLIIVAGQGTCVCVIQIYVFFVWSSSSLIEDISSVPSQCQSNCQGSEKILQLLIDKGANVNSVDKDGHTALDAALEANKHEGNEPPNHVGLLPSLVETSKYSSKQSVTKILPILRDDSFRNDCDYVNYDQIFFLENIDYKTVF